MSYSIQDDVQGIVDGIDQFLSRRGCSLTCPKAYIQRAIMEYINMRRMLSACQISEPRRNPQKPIGWTGEHEFIWRQWVAHRFGIFEWRNEVFKPVFGSIEQPWESAVGGKGWRDELLEFLPWWIKRTMEKFAEIDPTSHEERDDDASSSDMADNDSTY
jgi:hypothetical protein